MKNFKIYLLLHAMLMVYSMTGIFIKLAATAEFLSMKFIFFYGMVIVLLGFYAICWQQVIKRIPLTSAYANRAITVGWGLIWGPLFFHEQITIGKIAGIACVITGIVFYAIADGELAKAETEKTGSVGTDAAGETTIGGKEDA
ncbi:MAG: transporter [Lachnospiraceae bacterium]|nr:transporter [Lachnospiraceae bacterium]